ncbi:MAG: DUF58 domain-containing protein [Candidatus Nanohalobium sp.]
MDADDFIGSDDVVEKVDVEVKRVSDLFRFLLKYKEQFQASGIEFSDLREYQTSDDASRIDWKNSAKSMDLFVKEYEEEKDMDVFIVLDGSDTMMFGTTDQLKSEYCAILTAALAYASIDAGLNVGFGIWGDEEFLITPDGGEAQYQKILHEVTNFDNYGGEFDLEEALTSIIGQIKANTAVFVISDFLDVEHNWKAKMTVASEKFRHILNVMVRDPRDRRLPESGNVRFRSVNGEQLVANTSKVREEFEEEVEKQEKHIESQLNNAGAAMMDLETTKNFAAAFSEYFEGQGGGNW